MKENLKNVLCKICTAVMLSGCIIFFYRFVLLDNKSWDSLPRPTTRITNPVYYPYGDWKYISERWGYYAGVWRSGPFDS